MRTVVVQGGWRTWALLVVGAAILLVLGITVGLVMLGVIAVAGLLLLGRRALQTIGLGKRPIQADTTTAPEAGIIDGEFRVMSRSTTVASNQLPDPDR